MNKPNGETVLAFLTGLLLSLMLYAMFTLSGWAGPMMLTGFHRPLLGLSRAFALPSNLMAAVLIFVFAVLTVRLVAGHRSSGHQ